jgi:hypothetical protein
VSVVLWRPLPALAITVLIVAVATLLAMLVVPPASGDAGERSQAAPMLLAWQAIVVAMVLLAAARPGGQALRALGLDRAPRPRSIVAALVGLLAIAAPYNVAVFAFAREHMLADLAPFSRHLGGPSQGLFVLAVCIGAPIAEELLFRGFLLPALARSRLGFWGAAVVSTLGWTGLHAGYSVFGLVEVLLIGLYLCWVFRASGNLWVAIAVHTIYNSALTAVLIGGFLRL